MSNHHEDYLLKHLNQVLNDFRCPAPEELWQGISDDLDNLSDSSIDQHLHQEFKHFHQKAPLSLWDSIVNNLPESAEATHSDDMLDEEIRNAYTTPNQAPELIWWKVEQQLNIDGIWRDMTPQLNQMRKNYRWTTRLRQLSVAALLLLLIRGCGWFPTHQTEQQKLPNAPIVEQTGIQTTPISTAKNEHNNVHNAAPNINNSLPSTTEKEEQASTSSIQTPTHELKSATATPTPKTTTPTPNELKQVTHISPLATVLQNTVYHQLPNLSEEEKAQQNTTPTDISKLLPSIEPLDLAKTETVSEVLIEPLYPNTLAQPEKEITPTQNKAKAKFRPYVEIGLIGAIRNAVHINDVNMKILSSQTNKPVDLTHEITASYGLGADYYYARRHALSIDFWLNSKLRKDYEYHYNRGISTTRVESNYLKLAVAERFSIFRYGFSSIQNSLDIKGGAYIARLKSETITYTNKLPLLPETSKWEGGLVFSLGQKHQFRPNLSFEYAVQSEIGLSSVLLNPQSGKQNIGLFGFGAYAALRYRF